MGCDIHFHVEHRNKYGEWTEVYKPEHRKIGDNFEYTENYYGYSDRHYDLFGILAGVRVYGCEPIVEPRGIPVDVSRGVKADFEDWGSDAHTPSWLTLREVLDFDWSKNFDGDERLVPLKVYEEWDKKGYPPMSCGGASNSTVFTPKGYEEHKKSGEPFPPNSYVVMTFGLTYGDVAENFLARPVERCRELDPNPENVRFVFWFDN